MALQMGSWTANISGTVDKLIIQPGAVTGEISVTFGSFSGTGFWSEEAQRIVFFLNQPNQSGGAQAFTGYAFPDSMNLLGVTGSDMITICGTAESFGLPSQPVSVMPSAKSPCIGWYAQIGID